MKETLHTAIQYLASVCDGASKQDGEGFAKGDSYNGKYLASLPLTEWDKDCFLVAAEYAMKYNRQIRHIIGDDYKPFSDYIWNLSVEQGAKRDRVTVKRQSTQGKKVAKPSIATFDGSLIVVDTPYNANFVTDSKKIPSRKYAGGSITTFKMQDVKAVLELCDLYEIEVQFDVPAIIPSAPATSPVPAPTPVNPERKVVVKKDVIHIYFPYNATDLAAVKALGVCKYETEPVKHWSTSIINAHRVVEALFPLGFDIAQELHSAAKQSTVNKESYNAESTTFRREIPGMRKGFAILPHQWVPIEWALKNKHILNADSQGLGKTITTLATAILAESRRTVVVCPSSLTQNWQNETEMFFEEGVFSTFHAEGRTVSEIPEGTNLVIVGWPNLSFWIDTINAWRADVVVVDEAHYGKSGKKSQRGDAFISLGKNNAEAIKVALTGTPILNRPLELLAVIQFFGIEKMFGGVGKFKNRYCDPQLIPNTPTPYPVYSYNGATNIPELHDILTSSGVYVRRTKKLLMDQGLLKKKYVNKVEFFDYEKQRTPTYIRLNAEEKAQYA